ncbi:MAG TPA: YerC/YecD family TrpR-related protein [Syntrophomonadaceae bacterium]|nr:YerC/YecD family TrpR-related protein [Syntrophomonadaceae bacterium]
MAYKPNWQDPYSDFLVKAILTLETVDDVNRFLDDLCTISEIKAMGQRLQVARLLKTDTTYNKIAQDTGASTATISRVNRCLNYGAGGYKKVLKILDGGSSDEK